MVVLSVVATIAYYLLFIYFFVMWARFILDLARSFARSWRPRGFGLLLAELVFSLTDPPIRTMRRLVPPIRVGGAALDLAWSLTMLIVVILIYITFVLKQFA